MTFFQSMIFNERIDPVYIKINDMVIIIKSLK